MTGFASQLRWLGARVIAHVPGNTLRVLLYRSVFRYDLAGARVGFGTIIDCRSLTAPSVRIGRFNTFIGPMDVRLGPGCQIGDRNTFVCSTWAIDEPRFLRSLDIGRNCLITGLHFFDVTGAIRIGDGSWFAGRASEVWTHGAGGFAADVVIGRCSYVGSSCRFAPGSAVGDGCLVAMGSVVTSAIMADDALIGGVPARTIRQPYSWPSKRDRDML